MFGKKRMSSTDKFIIARGRAVGNIMPPAKSKNLKDRGTAAKTAPNTTKVMKGIKTLPNPGTGLTAGKARPLSPGQVNTVKK